MAVQRQHFSHLLPALRPESDRLLHLDALRLIASAGIVVAHMSGLVEAGFWSAQLGIAARCLALFVDMFFALSGFVIAFVYLDKVKTFPSYRYFLRKRLARLAPLHWATLAVFCALGLYLRYQNVAINHIELFDWRCLPVNFLFLHSTGLCPHLSFNAPSWSISAEMCMYVSAPILFWIVRRSPATLFVLAISIWLALTLEKSGENPWMYWTWNGGFARALPSFMFGVWLFGVRQSISRLPFSTTGFWICILGYLVGSGFGLPATALLLILYAAVTFGVAADSQHRRGPLISALAAGGQLTYSSYLLHSLVSMVVLNTIADRLLHTHATQRNLFALIAFLLVWPLSYVSFVFFERPARQWIGGTTGHTKSRDAARGTGL